MRLTATEVGFFEDYEDDEALEVGIAWVDDAGAQRSLVIQRSTYQPDEQEVQCGMDSYCVSNEQGLTVYGCLRRVRLDGSLLTFEFIAEDAEILAFSTSVELDLSGVGVDKVHLSTKLGEILDWGSRGKRPELVGLNGHRAVG